MSDVGKVTRVQIAEGDSSVRVDVRLSPSREYEDLLFRTPSTGVWFVPEIGDVVEVTTVGDTRKIAHSPMQSPGFQIPDDAEQGDIIFKPSPDVTFRMDKSGGIDLVTGSGYLNINSDGSIEMSETPTEGSSYSDEDAQDAVGSILSDDFTYDDANDLIDLSFDAVTQTELGNHTADSDAHHTKTSNASELTDVSADSVSDAHHSRYTDSDAETAINNDADHGSTASHDYFSEDHSDLTNVNSDDHHTKTTSQTDLSDFSSDSENIYVQDTEPSSPSENDIWIDTS